MRALSSASVRAYDTLSRGEVRTPIEDDLPTRKAVGDGSIPMT